MKLIKRLVYIDRLRNVRGTPDIKIIVGVRIVNLADWLCGDGNDMQK